MQFCSMLLLRTFGAVILLFSYVSLDAQSPKTGPWLFTMSRDGGIPVYVTATIEHGPDHPQLIFINDAESIIIDLKQANGDSLNFSMPLFETSFMLKKQNETFYEGSMMKGTSSEPQLWHVTAEWGKTARIPQATGKAEVDISGRWSIQFQRPDGSWRPAVAEWKQLGNKLTGTIINPSGDYRFLEGEVWENKFYVTAFDGSHIYAFKGSITNDSTVQDGLFFSGRAPGDSFRARKDPFAKLPEPTPVAEMKPGLQRLSFRFPDLDSNLVGINDLRFRGKVTIVQLMGSWCPNCMDETLFLSNFYNEQKTKEVEIISLAYELSTDFKRSSNSLRKFQQRFGVQYPMLISGVKSSDADKGAKTLPELTDIKYFPTTIFLDKNGRVRKVHNGFYGPGAPEYFEAYKKDFFETLELLKNE